MADDLLDIAVAVAADVAIDKAAKRHLWVRALRAVAGVLLFGIIATAIFMTFWYS